MDKIPQKVKDEIMSIPQGMLLSNLIPRNKVGKKNNRKNRKLRDIRIKNAVMGLLRTNYFERGYKLSNVRIKEGVLWYNLIVQLPATPTHITVNLFVPED